MAEFLGLRYRPYGGDQRQRPLKGPFFLYAPEWPTLVLRHLGRFFAGLRFQRARRFEILTATQQE